MVESASMITAMGEEQWKPITEVTISTCLQYRCPKQMEMPRGRGSDDGRESHLNCSDVMTASFIRKQTP